MANTRNNDRERLKQRRDAAAARQAAYNALSTQEKLDKAQGAKERTKLGKLLRAEGGKEA